MLFTQFAPGQAERGQIKAFPSSCPVRDCKFKEKGDSDVLIETVEKIKPSIFLTYSSSG